MLCGSRDDTVRWEPVVERARELSKEGRTVEVVELSAYHHFVGQAGKVGARVAEYPAAHPQ